MLLEVLAAAVLDAIPSFAIPDISGIFFGANVCLFKTRPRLSFRRLEREMATELQSKKTGWPSRQPLFLREAVAGQISHTGGLDAQCQRRERLLNSIPGREGRDDARIL
jgi:hypothetical protein